MSRERTTQLYVDWRWDKTTATAPLWLGSALTGSDYVYAIWQPCQTVTILPFISLFIYNGYAESNNNYSLFHSASLIVNWGYRTNINWFVMVVAFSSLARIFGRMFDHSFPACVFFFFFLKWRHSLGQDQSTVAERAETTVAECFLTNCVRARFLIDSHTMPGPVS